MDIFTQISLILAVALGAPFVLRLLKQPLVAAYIITGFMCTTFFLRTGDLGINDTFSVFSDLGVTILLFIVGISLSPKALKTVGKNAFLAGSGQMIFTTFAGYVLAKGLGFHPVSAILLAVALSFSSTIIVLKLLSDMGDAEKLYGKLSIGILLLQDIVASLCLIFLTTLDKAQGGALPIILLLVKGGAITFSVWLVSSLVLGRLAHFFAKSQESLFLFSVAWGFGISALFGEIGFSREIGALVAGIALSTLPYGAEISSKLKSLRDFFVIIFFIALGSKISASQVALHITEIAVLSLFVVLIKPLVTFIILIALGYNHKVSYKTGVSIAQVSEFSLIFGLLAFKLGYAQEGLVQIITLTCIVAATVSTYLIKYADKTYPLFVSTFLKAPRLETAGDKKQTPYDVILFGCNRVGWDFVKAFKNLGAGFLAVDYNPDTVEELSAKGINCIYGDAEDTEFLDGLNVGQARMIVSTIPDYETSVLLLEKIRQVNNESVIVLISYNVDDALEFYEKGASYVILPHFISAQHAMKLLEDFGISHQGLEGEKNNHIAYLKERKNLGHVHPPHLVR